MNYTERKRKEREKRKVAKHARMLAGGHSSCRYARKVRARMRGVYSRTSPLWKGWTPEQLETQGITVVEPSAI